MENTVTFADSALKLSLTGDEFIIALDGRNVKIPLSVMKSYLGIAATGNIVPQPVPGLNLGSPVNSKVYFGGPGEYILNGVATPMSSPINMFFWDKDDWEVLALEIDIADKVNSYEIGKKEIAVNTNILASLIGSDLNNEEIWSKGYLSSFGGREEVSASWRFTKNYIQAYPGTYGGYLHFSGNACLVGYDDDLNIVQVVSNTTSPLTYNLSFTLNDDVRFVRTSYSQGGDTNLIKASSILTKGIFTSEIFTTPGGVSRRLRDFGFKTVPLGTNFLRELTGSNYEDEALWGKGFLDELGKIQGTTSTWRYSKRYYEVAEGFYNMYLRISGNAKAVLYDSSLNAISYLSGGSPDNFPKVVKIEKRVKYIRVSELSTGNSADILMSNTEPVTLDYANIGVREKINQQNTEVGVTGSAVVNLLKRIKTSNRPVISKTPVVSFISDDARRHNDWYIDILNEKNVKSTFAVVTGWMADALANDSLTKEEVLGLYKNGHDIAGHTFSHPNLSTIPLAEAEEELKKCKLMLLELGINPEVFVPPSGGTNPEVEKLIRKYFKASFVTRSSVETTINSPIRSFKLNRESFDAGSVGVSMLETCKSFVDTALLRKEWLVFAIHPQYPEYIPSGGAFYETRRNELRELIDYIRSKNIPIIPAKDALVIWSNIVEIGNYGVDDDYYEMGMNGAERGRYLE